MPPVNSGPTIIDRLLAIGVALSIISKLLLIARGACVSRWNYVALIKAA